MVGRDRLSNCKYHFRFVGSGHEGFMSTDTQNQAFLVEVLEFDEATQDFEPYDIHGPFESADLAKSFVQKTYIGVHSDWEKVVDRGNIWWQNFSVVDEDRMYIVRGS